MKCNLQLDCYIAGLTRDHESISCALGLISHSHHTLKRRDRQSVTPIHNLLKFLIPAMSRYEVKPHLNENGIPDFDDLPLRKEDPERAAWGLYGGDDELGTLNRLTDARVAVAAKTEIQTGVR